jgi:hypothetical protein
MGHETNLKTKNNLHVKLIEQAQVKRIEMWRSGRDARLWGLQLFDKAGGLIAQSEDIRFKAGYNSKQILLEDDERIIGVRARKQNDMLANQYDVQFVIGRLV